MASTPSRNHSSAVKIPGASQFRLQTRLPASYATLPDRLRSLPMNTPNVREVAPPPLPPPRWVEDMGDGRDSGWEFNNQPNGNKGDMHHRSVPIKQGSSLLGGLHSSPSRNYNGPEKKIDLEASKAHSATLSGYKSDESDSSSKDVRIPDLRELLDYNKLQSERQMGQKTLERSSQAYDKHLLSRIGGSRMLPLPPGSAATDDSVAASPPTMQKPKGQLRPLAMPERRHSDMDARSPHTPWTPGGSGGGGSSAALGGDGAPPSSVASPPFSGIRSPLSEHGLERNLSHPQRNFTAKSEDPSSLPGRLIHRDSFEQGTYSEQDQPMRSPGMHLGQEMSPAESDDYQQNSKIGQKRRAQSPPTDLGVDQRLPNGVNSNGEAWQRRQLQTVASRNPQQTARFQNPNSLSSTASSAPNASYPSSYNVSNPSTSTRYSSDRSSPNSYPNGDGAGNSSPHASLPVHSPNQSDTNRAPPVPQRRPTTSNLPRAPGLWICDCCPKKPKKFESEDELRIHEMEKQYICQYCHNRFKNKNEAERHQNSLHLRRHSWSCAALTSFEAAFHPTPSNSVMASIQGPNYNPNNSMGSNGVHNPGAYPGSLHSTPTDTCGYCGMEFVNPPNWDDRVEHLNHVHKFGECNQSKKFFRADHFRQHLKHSHAGTSGKWTNMLENACMKDEPPPQPIGQAQLPPGMPGITMVGQQQLLAAAAAAAAAGVGQGSMSGYGSPGLSQSAMGSPLSSSMGSGSMSMGNQIGLGLMGMDQPAGQQAIMNATGPMGGGGPPAPIASMMSGGQQPLHHSMHQPHQQSGQVRGPGQAHEQ